MSLPKSLVEVLEEEDLRLYGRDGALAGRRWELLPEEITDGRGLARALSEYLQADAPDEIRDWAKAHGHDVRYKAAVANEVNAILERLASTPQWLFDHLRFRGTRKPPFDKLGAANAEPDRDAIYNINRRIFDVLFDEWVKPAADTRYAALVTRFHERASKGNPRTAFCISGGGIRSATFALGVMQRLAVEKVLDKFDYISTVSGGGYIGSWLSSWTRRDPWGIRGVSALLAESPAERLNPEPVPIRHLRAFSNYLTPRLGILSADTWALVATYLRNLLLNWVVLVPLLAGVLAVPRFMVSAVIHPALDPRWPAVDSTRAILWVGLFCLAAGLLALVSNRPTVDKKKQRVKALTDGKFIRSCVVPTRLRRYCSRSGGPGSKPTRHGTPRGMFRSRGHSSSSRRWPVSSHSASFCSS